MAPIGVEFLVNSQREYDELRKKHFAWEKQVTDWDQQVSSREASMRKLIPDSRKALSTWAAKSEEIYTTIASREADKARIWKDLEEVRQSQAQQAEDLKAESQ